MMTFVENDVAFDTLGESRMMPPLVGWLRDRRWLREDSIVVRELPINGRRVDLVTMTRSGVIAAFELKLGGFARVLEQAAYNRHNFDKSWIVIGSQPRLPNIDEAARFGVGIIVVSGAKITVVLRPGHSTSDPQARSRLRRRLMEIGDFHV